MSEEKWSIKDITEPGLIHRKRLPTRAYDLPPKQLSLNGLWDFSYQEGPVGIPHPGSLDFETTITDFKDIEVPGHWQLQGFGEPHYTNTAIPFAFDPPNVPSENPTGVYQKRFYVPTDWAKDYEIRLRFEGVDSAYHVFVGSELVGYSHGSRNPAEFDITEYLNYDSFPNCITVIVYQWSIGTYMEDQDMWWLSGIFRDVTLLGFPKSGYINDFVIKTDLDSEYKHSQLDVKVDTSIEQGTLNFVLSDASGAKVFSKTATVTSKSTSFVAPVTNPHKWTAEDPYLYTLDIELLTASRESSYSVSHVVGFRKVEMKDGSLCVNGVPIMFRGVCKHEHHRDSGRALPLESVKEDLLSMKRLNINAIRCSHYPNIPKFYELCDRLGFWLIDEADLETQGVIDAVKIPIDTHHHKNHSGFDMANSIFTENPDYLEAYLDRGRQMVKRDINHPSVVIWSLGNESLYGENHRKMKVLFNEIDGTRPIHYEGDIEAETSDMLSTMYMRYDMIEKYALGNHKKPLMVCEYAYSLGNGPGGLLRYQELFEKHFPKVQGGFVWEWSNHGLTWKFPDGTVGLAQSGDFPLEDPKDAYYVYDGIVSSTHKPDTPSVIELKKVYSPVSLTDVGSGKYELKNLLNFAALDFNLTFKIVSYIGDSDRENILASGSVECPALPARKTTTLDLPAYPGSEGEIWITWSFKLKNPTNWADAGHEVGWFQFQLQDAKPCALVIPNKWPYTSILQENDKNFALRNQNTVFSFDIAKGKIDEWCENTNGHIIKGLNSLTFWRYINNDFDKSDPIWKQYRVNEIKQNVRDVSINTDFTDSRIAEVVVKSLYAPPVLAWGIDTTTTYTLSTGQLTIKVHMKPQAFAEGYAPPTLPRIGWEFTLPKRLNTVKWFGRGPLDSYADRKHGQAIGIYNSSVEDMDVYNDYPQENGNRIDTRWVKISTPFESEGFKVTAEGPFSFKISNKDYTGAKHPFEVKPGPTVLRLDCAQQGFGSIFGPGVEEKYKVPLEEKTFSFTLTAL